MRILIVMKQLRDELQRVNVESAVLKAETVRIQQQLQQERESSARQRKTIEDNNRRNSMPQTTRNTESLTQTSVAPTVVDNTRVYLILAAIFFLLGLFFGRN